MPMFIGALIGVAAVLCIIGGIIKNTVSSRNRGTFWIFLGVAGLVFLFWGGISDFARGVFGFGSSATLDPGFTVGALFTLFAYGTVLFWLLLAAEAVVLFTAASLEEGALAGWSIVVAVLLLNFFGGIPIISFLWHNPLWVIPGAVGYLAMGVVYSAIRWDRYAASESRKYAELKKAFLAERNEPKHIAIPEALKEEFRRVARSRLDRDTPSPQAKENKALFAYWITDWPWDGIWWVCGDLLKEIVDEIVRRLQGFMQKISDRHFRGTENDM